MKPSLSIPKLQFFKETREKISNKTDFTIPKFLETQNNFIKAQYSEYHQLSLPNSIPPIIYDESWNQNTSGERKRDRESIPENQINWDGERILFYCFSLGRFICIELYSRFGLMIFKLDCSFLLLSYSLGPVQFLIFGLCKNVFSSGKKHIEKRRLR